MTKEIKIRIYSGISANVFSQATTIFIQLFSLPIFLYYWDSKIYGEWLILSAIPSYLSMADIGILPVATNKMTIAIGKKDFKEANQIFQSALIFVLTICSIIFFILAPLTLLAPLPSVVDKMDYRIAILALSAGVIIGLFGGLSGAIFKSTDRYAAGTFYGSLLSLLEWVGGISGLIFIGSFSGVALSSMAARLAGTILISYFSSIKNYKIKWGFENCNKSEILAMIKPAFAFMVFPAGNAISLQGMTILTGYLLGPTSVVIFNAYRTIARVTVQANSVLSHALWPEFSKLFGAGDILAIRSMYRKSFTYGLYVSIGFSIGMLMFSPLILKLWTHGTVPYEIPLMVIMLAYSSVASISHVPRVLLMATNSHGRLAIYYFINSLLIIGFGLLFGKLFGIFGLGLAMLILEFMNLVICLKLARRLLVCKK